MKEKKFLYKLILYKSAKSGNAYVKQIVKHPATRATDRVTLAGVVRGKIRNNHYSDILLILGIH